MPTPSTASEPKPPTSTKQVVLSEFFEDWLKRTLGFPRSPLHSLESDDDWTFVIKMHAIVEAALNHLLIVCLNDANLATLSQNFRRTIKEKARWHL